MVTVIFENINSDLQPLALQHLFHEVGLIPYKGAKKLVDDLVKGKEISIDCTYYVSKFILEKALKLGAIGYIK